MKKEDTEFKCCLCGAEDSKSWYGYTSDEGGSFKIVCSDCDDLVTPYDY